MQKLTFYITVIYLAVVSVFLVRSGAWFHPDQFFVVAILATFVLGRFKQFIRDWSVPVILFLSYDYLRGLAPELSLTAHIYPMIDFDQALFGVLPTLTLQSCLFADGSIHWYDYLSVALYMLHFTVPMVAAFIFWMTDKVAFKSYFLALLILSYAGFFTYVFFPAMPPWMAGNLGYIPTVQKVMDIVFANSPRPLDFPSLYHYVVGANLVAAVPSLHAAYPWLTFLCALKRFRRLGWIVLPYTLGVWFTIVYSGEHYVFDIVVGVLYATLAFLVVSKWTQIQRQMLTLGRRCGLLR